jgi:hypothetical protein
MPLDEVCRPDIEPRRNARGDRRRYEQNQDGENPQRVGRCAFQEPGRNDAQRGRNIERREPQHHSASGGLCIEARVDDDNEQVPQAESNTPAVERLGNGERADQKARHSDHEQQPARRAIGSDSVRKPHVAAVHPEQNDEDEDDLCDSFDRGLLGKESRQLRQRENEDQIEEELQRRDANLFLGVVLFVKRQFSRQNPSRYGGREVCAIVPPWAAKSRNPLARRAVLRKLTGARILQLEAPHEMIVLRFHQVGPVAVGAHVTFINGIRVVVQATIGSQGLLGFQLRVDLSPCLVKLRHR